MSRKYYAFQYHSTFLLCYIITSKTNRLELKENFSKGSWIQGFEDSSDPPQNRRIKILKNYRKKHRRNRKNVKGADKVFRKQTLESLAPLLQIS